jgi:L-seryl-tRNA(Ser) seleniumtransferase
MPERIRTTRRRFLKGVIAAGGLGALWPSRLYASYLAAQYGDIYRRLGVEPLINAAGTLTPLTNSVLVPEAREAMAEASRYFVPLIELQQAAGARIAELTGAEAAMITSGAAGAIMLATAACVTRGDEEKIRRLPDTSGMKNEVVIPSAHRIPFDHAARSVGVEFVEVDTAAELEAAIGPKTAMLCFVNIAESRGPIKREEFIKAAKRAEVPVFNDAAAELPPVENLSKFLKQGFDLVCFSGGKALRGPAASGILMGRRDLIESASLNNNPHPDTIGRAAKVGKEQIMAVLAALEAYVLRDHEEDQRSWRKFLARIAKSVEGIPTTGSEIFVPPGRGYPHLRLAWDVQRLGLSYEDCSEELMGGEPRIAVRVETEGIEIASINLNPGEDRIIGLRLSEVLRKAAAG